MNTGMMLTPLSVRRRTAGLILFIGMNAVANPPMNTAAAQSPGERDRSRDSVLVLPVYTREHMQTHPAIYERYKTPGQCFFAAARAQAFFNRDKRRDTILQDARTDTFPSIVPTVARACGGKFDAMAVPLRDLVGTIEYAFWANRDSIAEVAYRRIIREFPTTDSVAIRLKASHLLDVVRAFAQRRPLLPDPSWLLQIGAQIDSLGPIGTRFANVVYSDPTWADETLDYNFGIRTQELAEKAWNRMSYNDRVDWSGTMTLAYANFAKYVYWKSGPDTAITFLNTRAVPGIAAVRAGDEGVRQQVQSYFDSQGYLYDFIGDSVPPIQAKHWFDANGATDTRYPRVGTPTLVMFLNPNCAGACYDDLTLIREMHKRFHARGLTVVVVTKTSGFFRSEVAESSAQEIELIRKYYLEFLKLPVTLAIDESRFSRIPDGRRFAEPSPWRRTWPNSSAVLINKNGTFAGFGYWKGEWKRAVADIEKVL